MTFPPMTPLPAGLPYDPRAHGARCDLCPLRKGHVVVPPAPPKGTAKLVLVGEGPGRTEERDGVPFVGVSGQLLDQVLDEVSIARADAHVTNAALCRGETDKDNERAAECCAPRLLAELARLPENAPLILLGKSAARSVLGVKSILLARGFVWTLRSLENAVKAASQAQRSAKRKLERAHGRHKTKAAREKLQNARLRFDTLSLRHRLAGRTALPTVHPAFVLRADVWVTIFRLDLARAARWLSGELRQLDDAITEAKTLRGFKPGTYLASPDPRILASALARLGPTVAVDIETESQQDGKPLSAVTSDVLCCGFSDGQRTVVIGPWSKTLHAGLVTQALARRTAVFHNGFNFDHIALERDGVRLRPEGLEDTLLAHHAFASHFPQRLDHVVATFCDSSPWKIKHGMRGGAEEKGLLPAAMEIGERHLYNARDCVLSHKAWVNMQADLAEELAVYAHDKRLAAMCKGMQVVGVRVDKRRKALLDKKLKLRSAALKGRMRALSRRPAFNPMRLQEVRKVLFGVLRAPMLNPTASGLASTSNATLESLKVSEAKFGDFATTLLKWRIVVKVKNTYVKPVHVLRDGRVHYNTKSFGANSGRLAARYQSCPRWSLASPEERVREMYTASSRAHELVYFDLSQAEARAAANVSGDENFIASCQGDVHAGNALVLFPDERERIERDAKGKHCPQHSPEGQRSATCNCGKPFRDIGKNAGFAVAYLAEAETVFAFLRSQGFPVLFGDVVAMMDRLRGTYARYYEYVRENVEYVQAHGYLRTPLVGRVRWFGYFPPPTEVANFPIQSLIADAMNLRLPEICERAPKGAKLVLQIHDAGIFDCPRGGVDELEDVIARAWAEPVRLRKSVVCREDREFLLPAEIKRGRRWSDF